MSRYACPQCSAEQPTLLGSLGTTKCLRCRACGCGWDWVSLGRPRKGPGRPTQRHQPANRKPAPQEDLQ